MDRTFKNGPRTTWSTIFPVEQVSGFHCMIIMPITSKPVPLVMLSVGMVQPREKLVHFHCQSPCIQENSLYNRIGACLFVSNHAVGSLHLSHPKWCSGGLPGRLFPAHCTGHLFKGTEKDPPGQALAPLLLPGKGPVWPSYSLQY